MAGAVAESRGGHTNRKQRLAAGLWDLADLEQAASSRRSFQARAYRRAVWSLDHLTADLEEDRDEVLAVPGIGAGIASMVEEFRHSGTLRRLETLRPTLPSGSAALSRLPRMTPRRLRQLKHDLGVDQPAELLAAIDAGAAQTLPGVGAGTATVWRGRLLSMGPGMPIHRAAGIARMLADHIEAHVAGLTATVAGAVRRLDELVDAIELLAVGGSGLRRFLRQSAVVQAYRSEGDRLHPVTLAAPAIVHQARRSHAGAALVEATGPPAHLAALAAISGSTPGEWEASTERELYQRFGQEVPPPPARDEGFPPPGLVRPDQLRGDLHLHSDWSSDGRQTLGSIVEIAARRAYEYIAITDHAANLGFGGLTSDDLLRQREEISILRDAHPDIAILHGAELNIDRHGAVDYDDEVLEFLDFRLAAVHSFFDLPIGAQTERVLAAIGHPLIHAVAHLTGRRIGIRPPIELDMESVVASAAEHRTALEVNGHLDRLDLSAEHARLAVSAGAPVLADSDAHRSAEMGNVANAVGILQRAWAPTTAVANTWPGSDLLAWLRR